MDLLYDSRIVQISEADIREIESLFLQKKGITDLLNGLEQDDPVYDILQKDLAAVTQSFNEWFDRLKKQLDLYKGMCIRPAS